ncbi:hypothetical protein CSUI_001318, partial [Cystoisospora suis]
MLEVTEMGRSVLPPVSSTQPSPPSSSNSSSSLGTSSSSEEEDDEEEDRTFSSLSTPSQNLSNLIHTRRKKRLPPHPINQENDWVRMSSSQQPPSLPSSPADACCFSSSSPLGSLSHSSCPFLKASTPSLFFPPPPLPFHPSQPYPPHPPPSDQQQHEKHYCCSHLLSSTSSLNFPHSLAFIRPLLHSRCLSDPPPRSPPPPYCPVILHSLSSSSSSTSRCSSFFPSSSSSHISSVQRDPPLRPPPIHLPPSYNVVSHERKKKKKKEKVKGQEEEQGHPLFHSSSSSSSSPSFSDDSGSSSVIKKSDPFLPSSSSSSSSSSSWCFRPSPNALSSTTLPLQSSSSSGQTRCSSSSSSFLDKTRGREKESEKNSSSSSFLVHQEVLPREEREAERYGEKTSVCPSSSSSSLPSSLSVSQIQKDCFESSSHKEKGEGENSLFSSVGGGEILPDREKEEEEGRKKSLLLQGQLGRSTEGLHLGQDAKKEKEEEEENSLRDEEISELKQLADILHYLSHSVRSRIGALSSIAKKERRGVGKQEKHSPPKKDHDLPSPRRIVMKYSLKAGLLFSSSFSFFPSTPLSRESVSSSLSSSTLASPRGSRCTSLSQVNFPSSSSSCCLRQKSDCSEERALSILPFLYGVRMSRKTLELSRKTMKVLSCLSRYLQLTSPVSSSSSSSSFLSSELATTMQRRRRRNRRPFLLSPPLRSISAINADDRQKHLGEEEDLHFTSQEEEDDVFTGSKERGEDEEEEDVETEGEEERDDEEEEEEEKFHGTEEVWPKEDACSPPDCTPGLYPEIECTDTPKSSSWLDSSRREGTSSSRTIVSKEKRTRGSVDAPERSRRNSHPRSQSTCCFCTSCCLRKESEEAALHNLSKRKNLVTRRRSSQVATCSALMKQEEREGGRRREEDEDIHPSRRRGGGGVQTVHDRGHVPGIKRSMTDLRGKDKRKKEEKEKEKQESERDEDGTDRRKRGGTQQEEEEVESSPDRVYRHLEGSRKMKRDRYVIEKSSRRKETAETFSYSSPSYSYKSSAYIRGHRQGNRRGSSRCEDLRSSESDVKKKQQQARGRVTLREEEKEEMEGGDWIPNMKEKKGKKISGVRRSDEEIKREEEFLRGLALCLPYLSLEDRVGGVALASKACLQVVWSAPIHFADFSSSSSSSSSSSDRRTPSAISSSSSPYSSYRHGFSFYGGGVVPTDSPSSQRSYLLPHHISDSSGLLSVPSSSSFSRQSIVASCSPISPPSAWGSPAISSSVDVDINSTHQYHSRFSPHETGIGQDHPLSSSSSSLCPLPSSPVSSSSLSLQRDPASPRLLRLHPQHQPPSSSEVSPLNTNTDQNFPPSSIPPSNHHLLSLTSSSSTSSSTAHPADPSTPSAISIIQVASNTSFTPPSSSSLALLPSSSPPPPFPPCGCAPPPPRFHHEIDGEQLLMLPLFTKRIAPRLTRLQALGACVQAVPLISCLGLPLRRLKLDRVQPTQQLHILHAWICAASRRSPRLSSLTVLCEASCTPNILRASPSSRSYACCFCSSCFCPSSS